MPHSVSGVYDYVSPYADPHSDDYDVGYGDGYITAGESIISAALKKIEEIRNE
jgi:hypothetical protein